MTKSHQEELSIQTNHWHRIASEILGMAGIELNGTRSFDIKVKNPDFCKRVLQEGSLGLGESYMDGWWECKRLDILFELIVGNELENKLPYHFRDTLRIAIARIFNLQNRTRAWIVGREHYDLGNDLFSLMLDPAMQYSCGYWKDATTLDEAQEDKLKLICEKLQLKPGMHVLDIGCGWGGLAAYAAQNYGVSVIGCTISVEQQKLAQEYCAGMNVEILLKDYRDMNEQFDRVVSIGMFEHVGPKNYRSYFDVAERCLKPDGLFLLHTIGSNRTDMTVDPWINRYIFPNGCLPSITQISQAIEGHFVMEDWHNFGSDYDRTLMAWYARFEKSWPELEGRYSARFERMFSYYLNACAGSFRARDIQLWQIVLSPKGIRGGIRVPR